MRSKFMTQGVAKSLTHSDRMNLVTTYYEQCVRAVRPFLDEKTFKMLEQQYALMRTKEHYDAIISQLAAVANDNNSSLPESYL